MLEKSQKEMLEWMRSQITSGVERESLTYLCGFKAAWGVET